jgi:hypothetical protein
MKDLQAKQAFKHKKEEAELSRYLQAPKLAREKTESQNMEQKLRDKHQKETNDLNSLFNEKREFFKNKRKELDNLEFQNRERHRREMTIYYNTFYDTKNNAENELVEYTKTKNKMIDRHSVEDVDKNNMTFSQNRRMKSEDL